MRAHSVLFIISSLRGGGAEQHLAGLCAYLSARGLRVTVCTLSTAVDPLEERIAATGAALERLPLRSLRELLMPRPRRLLRSIVERARPDILHAHLYHAEIAAALATRYTGAPLVVTRHSSGLEFGGFRRLVASAAARRIRRVIAVSDEAAAEALRTGVPPRRVVTIPNCVDTTVFRPFEAELRDGERAALFEQHFTGEARDVMLLGSLGGLKPVKNFAALVEAVAALAKSRTGGRPVRLMILGEGPARAGLEELARRLGLDAVVALPGYIERPELVLPLFDIFAFPSLNEGVPLALIEAMACGLPCVASEVGGIGPVLEGAGILVPAGDAGVLADALESLIEDEGERRRLGRLARVRAMERFDLQSWGQRILDLYEDLFA